jgi:nucleolar GTP-binding protein
MVKVKYLQSIIHERLTTILDEFPKIDEIHPFYADLMNVLYNKDHFKLALGQLAQCVHLVDGLGREYVKLIKYGDTLHRCKRLKVAGVGRMATLLKRQAASFAYLEEVRQHMSRLPSIDPTMRTLLLTGYPSVGKSSFMNLVTRANVDVQSWATTTKSLFVGHTDYKCHRWQVLDTPGILDRPLESRNMIEMQSVTALAYLRAAILFVVDPTESCGFRLQEQVSLFHSLVPLFTGKPIIVVLNKADLWSWESLDDEARHLIESICPNAPTGAIAAAVAASIADSSSSQVIHEGQTAIQFIVTSTVSKDGVQAVKKHACERLLASTTESEIASRSSATQLANRLRCAQPTPRDSRVREVCIPETISAARAAGVQPAKRPVEHLSRTKEALGGGAGRYAVELRDHHLLADPSWKDDVIPEIMEGHNIADFVDPDILAKVQALEEEEDRLIAEFEAAEAAAGGASAEAALIDRLYDQQYGNPNIADAKEFPRAGESFDPYVRKRRRYKTFEEEEAIPEPSAKRRQVAAHAGIVQAKARAVAELRAKGLGSADSAQDVARMQKSTTDMDGRLGRQGESDRKIVTKLPKWYFTGKRGLSDHNRR